jgi:hypothetical protein
VRAKDKDSYGDDRRDLGSQTLEDKSADAWLGLRCLDDRLIQEAEGQCQYRNERIHNVGTHKPIEKDVQNQHEQHSPQSIHLLMRNSADPAGRIPRLMMKCMVNVLVANQP